MDNIALSFSGGGFRAAAYSLGCLAYLDHLKYGGGTLLQNVRYISSTSGGSITNLVYSSHIFKGKTFRECYDFLNEKLEGDMLLAEALTILNTPSEWKDRPDKSRNLINAFSMAYDKLLNRENFGLFSDGNHNPHLEEICVNATEFTNGLPFRFQSQPQDAGFPRGKVGNSYIFFKSEAIRAAHALRLSDILASSSCFPSGFEPLIFPKDYANKEVSADGLIGALSYKANEFTIKPYNHLNFLSNKEFDKKIQFGIMDGGITDNQGIDAFVKADCRREDNGRAPFDLYISCDVASYLMDGYTLPVQENKWYDLITLNGLKLIAAILVLWLPAMLWIWRGPWHPWQYITGTISGIFVFAGLLFVLGKIKAMFKEQPPESTWTVVLKKFRSKFRSLTLGDIRVMISARLKSVFILSGDIYLKQIRRMYYEKLFTTDKYKDRVIQNTIYDLSKVNFSGNDLSDHPLHPSGIIIDTAEKARTMGTTLWFDQNHRKEKVKEAIIATGQFTTCYNLLRYLAKKSAAGLTPEEISLQARLSEDWDRFCEDPFHLL